MSAIQQSVTAGAAESAIGVGARPDGPRHTCLIVMRYLTVRRYPHRSAPRSRRLVAPDLASTAEKQCDPDAPDERGLSLNPPMCLIGFPGRLVNRALQPGGVGVEVPGGDVAEHCTVFEVADGELDDGAVAMEPVNVNGVTVQVGEEGVMTPPGHRRCCKGVSQPGATHDQSARRAPAACAGGVGTLGDCFADGAVVDGRPGFSGMQAIAAETLWCWYARPSCSARREVPT